MSRTLTVVFFLLFAFGTLCWLLTVATTASLNSSDQAGNGMSYGYALIGVIVTWSVLAVLLAVTIGKSSPPWWITALAVVSVPLSAAAAVTVVNLLRNNRDFAGQWPIVTLVAAPLLMLFFALWSAQPALQTLVSRNFVFPAIWISVILLSVLPFPLRTSQKKRQARQRAEYATTLTNRDADERQTWRAQFDALSDTAHLRELLTFASNGSNLRDEALAKARTLPARQQHAVEMLKQNDGLVMSELRNLALESTPELCTHATEFLRMHAVRYQSRVTADNKRFIVAAQELDKYHFGMQWLVERGCAMTSAIDAYRETANLYPDSPERTQFLSRLDSFVTTAKNAAPLSL